MKNQNILPYLSKYLFWETKQSELDEEKHARYIIAKVLQYGMYSDWEKILNYYTLPKIVEYACKLKDLDKRTASFLSAISSTPKKMFLCYNTVQSHPKHWNF